MRRTADSHAQGTRLAGSVSAAGGLMPGCRGLRPRRNKLWDSPFPPGRGQGGWGQESKLKARLASSKQGIPPPPGAWFAPISQCRPGSAIGDARGGAPCIRKPKISPFPAGEERSASAGGGMGATKQAKGRVGKRQRRQAAPQGTAGAGRTSARRQMRYFSKQPQQQHLELHLL